jgi:hypothetical protein
MKIKPSLLFIPLFFMTTASQALKVDPAINEIGQALKIKCNSPEEDICTRICGHQFECFIQERFCRSCAGTQNLKLKRILDEVGTILVASDKILPADDLIRVLASGDFFTLHSRSIYNYSSEYNGAQINAQFRSLCQDQSDQTGILLIRADPITQRFKGIVGAICTHNHSQSTEFKAIKKNLIQ